MSEVLQVHMDIERMQGILARATAMTQMIHHASKNPRSRNEHAHPL